MNFIYPIFISFLLVFLSELGDKTQLLVLSFSSKTTVKNILLGVALGSFLSHGIAILFGSTLSILNNTQFQETLKFITYFSFIVFGIFSFISINQKEKQTNCNSGLINKIINSKLNYILIIAASISIGEFGDKTFLASIGLGIQYPFYKFSLILGAILGMVISDLIAILFGKLLSNKISDKNIKIISGLLFILFGIIGFLR